VVGGRGGGGVVVVVGMMRGVGCFLVVCSIQIVYLQ
jgi:hypothetical protein